MLYLSWKIKWRLVHANAERRDDNQFEDKAKQQWHNTKGKQGNHSTLNTLTKKMINRKAL